MLLFFYHEKMQIDCQSVHQSHFLRFSSCLKIVSRNQKLQWCNEVESALFTWQNFTYYIWRQTYGIWIRNLDMKIKNNKEKLLNYPQSWPSNPRGSLRPRPKVATPACGHGRLWNNMRLGFMGFPSKRGRTFQNISEICFN